MIILPALFAAGVSAPTAFSFASADKTIASTESYPDGSLTIPNLRRDGLDKTMHQTEYREGEEASLTSDIKVPCR
jgi:hypothetical protein